MTEQILLAFAEAWSSKNPDAIMAFFAGNCRYAPSICIGEKSVFEGEIEVRNAVKMLIEFDNSISSSVKNVYVNDDFGFWEWEYITQDDEKIMGCDAFKFRGNKIIEKNAFRKINL